VPITLKKFTVILDPEDDGGYCAYGPALPGCAGQGGDRNNALMNIGEAILLLTEYLVEDQPLASPNADGKDLSPVETADVVTEEIRDVRKAPSEDGCPLTTETIEIGAPYPVAA